MAMVFCKGCGKELHESAPTCPHCGAPQFARSAGANGASKADEGFFDLGLMPLKKYATFSGRARRKEYWYFVLVYMLAAVVMGILAAILGRAGAILTSVFYLGVIIPSLAVGVRRMHDTDRSGWWLIVPIAGFVFLCLEGQRAPNRFGDDPKN